MKKSVSSFLVLALLAIANTSVESAGTEMEGLKSRAGRESDAESKANKDSRREEGEDSEEEVHVPKSEVFTRSFGEMPR